MRFWDSSALVPLVIDEPTTSRMQGLLRDDPEVAVWLLTGVELLSATARLERQSKGLDDLVEAVRTAIRDLEPQWTLVTNVDAVRRRAGRLVGVHPLTSADALQLAAAQVLSDDRPDTLEFVTLDNVLAKAARLEGFHVLMA